MNKQSTSESDILDLSKKYIIENGFHSFNIRAITKECGISIGTIYNYFPSKNALIVEVIASIWEEIFEPLQNFKDFDSFIDAIECMYHTIESGNSRYSNFFSLHNLNFASSNKKEGIEMMNRYFSNLKKNLLDVLNRDTKVNQKMFDREFQKDKYIDYIFSLVLSLLLKKEDPKPLFHFITNYLY